MRLVASAIIATAIAVFRAHLIFSVSAGSENNHDPARSTNHLQILPARALRPPERGA
ncbi:MAG: hypothetical protein ACREVP_16370 [Burkholderiales bacterium]